MFEKIINEILSWLKEMENFHKVDWENYHIEDDYGAMNAYHKAADKIKEISGQEESDLERLINEFCVPLESDKICEELTVWSEDGGNSTWCEKNCGITNNGECPGALCYKAWLNMKRIQAAEQGKEKEN